MSRIRSLAYRLIPAACLATLVGCSDTRLIPHPVEGKLVYADGSPVPGRANVTFHIEVDGKEYVGMGRVKPDGTFTLSTFAPNDGALAGTHWVTVSPIPGGEESPTTPTIAQKYAAQETSGLTATVERGLNQPVITVEGVQKR